MLAAQLTIFGRSFARFFCASLISMLETELRALRFFGCTLLRLGKDGDVTFGKWRLSKAISAVRDTCLLARLEGIERIFSRSLAST